MPRSRGFFTIGVYHPKHEVNIGGLWRSAAAFGAAAVFTVGRRYRPQAADTTHTSGVLPLYHYADLDDLIAHLPHACPLVGVELTPDAEPLSQWAHPGVACYLLGAEDHGLPPAVLEKCHKRVVIGGLTGCLNVATAGSIVMYDRHTKAWPTRVLARTARRKEAACA